MKNSLALIISFSSILLLFTGCSIGKETYENPNFTFEYPKEWKIGNLSNSEEFPDVDAFIYSLDESGNTIANMNITHVSVVGELDTELFAEQSITEAQTYPGYKKIKEQKLTVAGQKTKIITFEATGTDGEMNTMMQTYVLDGQTGYILTALMPADAGGTIKASVRNIFKSFKLADVDESVAQE